MIPLLCTTITMQHTTNVGSRFTVAVLSDLHWNHFCADFAQLGIHLVEVSIYELST
jgi:hypothetical protein